MRSPEWRARVLGAALAAAIAAPAAAADFPTAITYRTGMPGGTVCKLNGGAVWAMGQGSNYTRNQTWNVPVSGVGVTMSTELTIAMTNHANDAQVYCAVKGTMTVANGAWNCTVDAPTADASAICTPSASLRSGGGCDFELVASPR